MQLIIHPQNPQIRLIKQAVDILTKGGIIIFPTECAYVLGAQIGNKTAVTRLRQLRQVDKSHFFTLMCRDLSELAQYARVDNWAFKLLKQHTPGAYTFVLNATKQVPKRLFQGKQHTIGLRIPSHSIAQLLLDQLNEPLLCTTLIPPGESAPLFDPLDICEHFESQVELFINAGFGHNTATSVIDLSKDKAVIIRAGQGDISKFY